MADLFWFSLLLKMLASACVVAAAAAAVERVGPIFGALIATLPVSAGPAYVFLAMDHDDAFIAASALTSMVAAGSNAAFIAVYVFAAQSWSMPASVGAAVAAWLVSVLLAGQVGWTGPVLLVASLAAFGGTFLLIRPLLSVRAGEPPPSRWFDPVLRGMLVMLLVAAVVLSGRALGPQAAGIAALVPLIFISLSIILHARIGGRATAAVVGNSTLGLMGLMIGLAALHAGAIPLGRTRALLLALAICVCWNLMLLGLSLRRRRALLATRPRPDDR